MIAKIALVFGLLASLITVAAFVTGATSVRDWLGPSYKPPSYDCAQDRGVVEQTICADAALTAKDRVLTALFEKKRDAARGSDQDNLIETQRMWLAQRDQCHEPNLNGCIANLYNMRIAVLRATPGG